jgi:hypothetical protein
MEAKYKLWQDVDYNYEGTITSGNIVLISYNEELKTWVYFFDDKKFKRELPIIIYEKDIVGLTENKAKTVKEPKYKVGKEVKIKGSKTIGKIVSIEFDEEIKQYTYELLTEAKVHYTILESEIELVNLTTK